MEPFFSVIIPTYNRATLIGKAIDSVLTQTYTNWELLIIDDGSKDNTREVVEAYTDPRVKYIYQVNAERSAARNNGITQARGKYICFLDSDDYFLSNRLALLHTEMVKRNLPVAMFYTGLYFDNNGKMTEAPVNLKEYDNRYDKIALSVIHSQQTCIHKQVLDEYKYDRRFHIGEDMELWIRIVEKYSCIYLAGQCTGVALEHEGRSVNLEKNNSGVDQLKTLRHIFTAPHPGQHISPAVKSTLLGICYYGIARYHMYNGNRWEAVNAMLKCIMADTHTPQLKFRINILTKLLSFSSFATIRELIHY